MALDPPRRAFSEEEPGKGARDVDAAARAQKLHAMGWSLAAGIPCGAGVGLILGNMLVGLVMGPLVIYGIVLAIAVLPGRGASVVYMPSGAITPRRREYSRAKALEVRGQYEDAIRAYEVEILEAPRVPEPYLSIARLFRDELRELDSAVHWFRRAQREALLSPGESIRIHRELAEVFLYLRRDPRKAAPELARLAEEYPHTPDGEWAARELAQIKEAIAREMWGPPTDL